jgi:hypothetical protein
MDMEDESEADVLCCDTMRRILCLVSGLLAMRMTTAVMTRKMSIMNFLKFLPVYALRARRSGQDYYSAEV